MGDEVKRDVRQFEPPPWEREAFEALAAEALAAKATAARPVTDPANAPVHDDPPAAVSTPVAAAVDDKQVQVMLMELGREETTETRGVRLIARIAAIVTGLVGAGMLLGGVFALQKAGGTSVGLMGSAALSVFGLCFLGMAAWVWVRSNRLRGSR